MVTQHIKGYTKKEVTPVDWKPAKIKEVYTIRDVIKRRHRALVKVKIPYKPTDKEYIGSYQQAVTTVLENMSKKEVREAEKLVDLWNKEGALADVQLK